MKQSDNRCLLTIIVVFYNMRREAPKTLATLSPLYQQGVDASQYKVIAIDNGSSNPLDAEMVKSCGPNFEYSFFETMSMSPAAALNFGIEQARTPFVMLMIDGARLVSPGLVKRTLEAFKAFKNPFIYTLSLHLGSKLQNVSMLEGYNQQIEDALLTTVDWRTNGYELFSISNIENVTFSFFGRVPESNCFAVSLGCLRNLGGFDERFQTSGGGLVNLEIFARFVGNDTITPVALIGEASFHQFHGGVSTNVRNKEHPLPAYLSEYENLFGKPYVPPEYYPYYWGAFSEDTKQLTPGSTFRTYLKIATRFIDMGKSAVAKAILDFLLTIDSTDPDVHNCLGSLYLSVKDYKTAEQFYRNSIEHDYVSKAGRHVGLGHVLRLQGRLDEAIAAYQFAIQAGAAGALSYFYMSQIEQQRGDAGKAIQYLERSVAEKGGSIPPVLITLGNIYNEQSREHEAIEVFERALALNPSNIWGKCSLAAWSWRLKEIPAAQRCYVEAYLTLASATEGVSAGLYATLGNGLLNVKELDKAKEVAEWGLNKWPANPALHFCFGHISYQLSDWANAALGLRQALRRDHGVVPAGRMLAEIYRKNGDRNLARLMLKKVALKDPRNEVVAKELAQIDYVKPLLSEYEYDSLVFTHIPKCAGTTLRQIIADSAYYSGLNTEQIHVPGELGQSPFENMVELQGASIEALRARDLRVLADHSAYGIEKQSGINSMARPFYYTIVREPLERFLSYYYFFYYNPDSNYDNLKGTHLHELPTEKLAELIRKYANILVSYISGHSAVPGHMAVSESHLQQAKDHLENKYACFGIFESLSASVDILKSNAPEWLSFVEEPDKYLAKTNHSGDEKEAERRRLTPEIISLFKEHNQLDYQFYAFARDLFSRKYGVAL